MGSAGSTIEKIKFVSKWEPFEITSKVYIDCTGDADVYAAAGLPFEKGRPQDALLQPLGQMFRLGNVDMERFLEKAGIAIARGLKPGDMKESIVWFSASLSPWNDLIEEENFLWERSDFWGTQR
jgi:hypothetical protein